LTSSDLHGIARANSAAAHDRSVYAGTATVLFHQSAQNRRILGQVALSQRGHDAANAWALDSQADASEADCVADPIVLDETARVIARFDHEVRTKPRHFESAIRSERSKPVECGRRKQIHRGAVEKSPRP